MSERLQYLRHDFVYCIPTCPELLSSVRRKIEWLSDLTHVGGAVKVSWAEMEASQDSLVEPTCGNGRALRVRVQLGQDGILGRESESSASSECESSTVCGPSASDGRESVFGVFGTLWVASSCPRVIYCISSATANTLPFSPGFKCRNCHPSQSSTVIGHRPQHRSFTEQNAERVWRCLGGCVGDSIILRVRGAPEGIIMSKGLGCLSSCPMSKVRGRSCSRR
jgi:hypothetical protein